MTSDETPSNLSSSNISISNISLEASGGGGSSLRLEQIFIPLFFCLVILLGLVGNALAIFVVLKNKSYKQTTTNLYILNLSIADLLFLIFCVPFHALIYTYPFWPFGNVMCKFVHFLQYLSMVASILTMVAMSTERFMAVVHPLHTKHLRTPLSALLVSILVWVLAAIVAFPFPIVYVSKEVPDTMGGTLKICADDWKKIGATHDEKAIYYLMLFLISYVIPLVIIVAMNALMIRQLACNPMLSDASAFKDSARTKRKVIRLIVILVSVFLLCWIPAHICWLWASYGRSTLKTPSWTFYYLKVCSHALSYANSAMNPIIYCFMSANFRKGFVKALSCISCGAKKTSRNGTSKATYSQCTTDHTAMEATEL